MFISMLAYQAVNNIRKALGKADIHDSWQTIKNSAEELKLTLSIAKANGCNKAVTIKSFTSLPENIRAYYKAMAIDKKAMKPTYAYVPKIHWELERAANF
jgi:hypothetical protein